MRDYTTWRLGFDEDNYHIGPQQYQGNYWNSIWRANSVGNPGWVGGCPRIYHYQLRAQFLTPTNRGADYEAYTSRHMMKRYGSIGQSTVARAWIEEDYLVNVFLACVL